MSQQEFNEKYKPYVVNGFKGLEFDIPEVTKYLDKLMDCGLTKINEFKLYQIKVKFGYSRFYFECDLPASIQELLQSTIEKDINNLITKHNNGK